MVAQFLRLGVALIFLQGAGELGGIGVAVARLGGQARRVSCRSSSGSWRSGTRCSGGTIRASRPIISNRTRLLSLYGGVSVSSS